MSPHYFDCHDSGTLLLESEARFEVGNRDRLAYESVSGLENAHQTLGGVRQAAYETTKRVLDAIGSLCALIVLSPLFALISICIKLEDGGPIFFVQTRVGKNGRRFRFYKFRSMIPNAESQKGELVRENRHNDPRTFKIVNDPRITNIGRVLRRFSLDELPQFWNVFIGDMSLVGPRPPVPSEVDLYSAYDWRRLEVPPGLTCLWQVSGRSDLPFAQQVRLDVRYIENRSLAMDLWLLALTIPAVVTGRGAH